MKLNKIFAAAAAVLVFCMTAFAETTGDFTSFYVDSTGKTEIIGYFEDYGSGAVRLNNAYDGWSNADKSKHI
ncbi:MAG: hypothetical protein SOS24_03485 [Clostridia bacterium]|nr:hypothetical protein [Clostridia bacterium]